MSSNIIEQRFVRAGKESAGARRAVYGLQACEWCERTITSKWYKQYHDECEIAVQAAGCRRVHS